MSEYAVTLANSGDWPQLFDMLRSWPFKSYLLHDNFNGSDLENLCRVRAEKFLAQNGNLVWVCRSSAGIAAFAALSRLPWDSEQLGMLAARLDYFVCNGPQLEVYNIKRALADCVLQFCEKEGIRHLSARADASDLSSIHVLEEKGFIQVDGILTLALHLEESPARQPAQLPMEIRIATAADAEAAAKLAGSAYIYDRFHSDPAIPPERSDRLHANWLRNSCSGKAADAGVLAEENGRLLGFVTCKLNRDTKEHLGKLIGTIVLVATAKEASRRGIGRMATMAALDWFRQQGTAIVEVGTQLRNLPASRLYESCGFRLVGSSVSLRKLIATTTQ